MYKKICLIIAVALGIQMGLAQFKLPAYDSYTLPNGLTVYLVHQPKVPVTNISLIMPAGFVNEVAQNSGISKLTANMLMRGTQNYTAKQINEVIDHAGAELDISAGKEYAVLYAKFNVEHSALMFNLLQQVTQKPIFNAIQFDKEKQELLVSVKQAKQSPKVLVGQHFAKFLYNQHPYANNGLGSENTLQKLTVQNCKDYYKTYYNPAASAVVVSGSFNKNTIKQQIQTAFASWVSSGATFSSKKLQNNLPLPGNSNQVLLVNKPDAKEATFYIGGLGITETNQDKVGIEVINTLFGGRFTSMLNDELRVNSGLTYGARSAFSSMQYAGAFYISTFTATETAEPAIDKALQVLQNLHTHGVTDSALLSAKNYVKGQFPPKYETAEQIGHWLAKKHWYNLSDNDINLFEQKIDELTLSKANAIIQKYFPKNNLKIVVVGNASILQPILKKYGTVSVVQAKDDIK